LVLEDEPFTVRSIVLRHRRASAGAVALLVALIALTVGTAVSSSSRVPLSDSASCSEWAAGTTAQKSAYSHLYINEYGAYPNTARYAAAVQAAINRACTHAAALGEADDVSVLAALRRAF
jgi:hypothetical protein